MSSDAKPRLPATGGTPTQASVARFDHLVVAAADLATGVAWVRDMLGVEMGPGGQHPLMGTHNALCAMGEDCFLEVISVDPGAAPPTRTRWFGFDDPWLRRVLALDGPQLLTWVVNVPDFASLTFDKNLYGVPTDLQRGVLRWRFAVRPDGYPPAGGALPCLIEWPAGPHPATGMREVGLRLRELHLRHPQADWLHQSLVQVRVSALARIESVPPGEPAGLRAVLETPLGRREIGAISPIVR